MIENFVFGFFVLIVSVILSGEAFGQQNQNFEGMCRAKAKDVAVQMYQSCVTENRNKRVETIRKEYQQKLANLKNYYDQELKKIGGGSGGKVHQNQQPSTAIIQQSMGNPESETSATQSITTSPVQGIQIKNTNKSRMIEMPAPESKEEYQIRSEAKDAESDISNSSNQTE